MIKLLFAQVYGEGIFSSQPIRSLLSDLFTFLVKPYRSSNKEQYYINPALTVNPYPTLRVGSKRYYSPDGGMIDITYEQFVLLQHYHDRMKQDPKQVDYLLAVLFHRKKEFNPDNNESDAKVLDRLHPGKKMLLFWFYLGCLQWLGDLYPRVFSGGGKTVGNIYEAQLRVIDSLAGSDMTKKPAVRKGLLIDALVSMEENIRRQEEAENHNKRS